MPKLSRLRSYLELFMPSPVGMIFYVFLSIATIALNQVEGIKQLLRFPDDLILFGVVAAWADKMLTSLFGESRVSVIVVGAFWAIVGLVVYLFLRAIAGYVAELDDDLAVRKYVWPKGADRTRPLRITVERTLFRVIALGALAFIVFGPLASVLRGPIFVDFIGTNFILQYLVWFIAGVVVWHIAVVLLRLFLLRPRITGEA